MMEVTVARFKEVLGHFATGVTIIAAEGPVGFTCQTFNALSLEPLLITFAARSAGSSWPQVRDKGVIVASILGDDQESVARAVATSGPDKFAGVDLITCANGAPGIAGALAHVEASIVNVSTHGDHDVVVAEVTGLHAQHGDPLLYFRGGFGTFRP
jgi:flavin reductase (DIM6/NTAB) family NADH-FMN oxidoreductase RutF